MLSGAPQVAEIITYGNTGAAAVRQTVFGQHNRSSQPREPRRDCSLISVLTCSCRSYTYEYHTMCSQHPHHEELSQSSRSCYQSRSYTYTIWPQHPYREGFSQSLRRCYQKSINILRSESYTICSQHPSLRCLQDSNNKARGSRIQTRLLTAQR